MKQQLLLLFLLLNPLVALASDQQTLDSELPEVLHIDKIILEGQEYDKDDEITNSKIVGMKLLSGEDYEFSLTPFSVRIQTNLADAIQVNADFEECCSCDSRYSFDKTDLQVSPSTRIVNNPHNMIESDFFTPKFVAHKDTVLTKYRGKLVITLGRI